jgi:hypothetical protein
MAPAIRGGARACLSILAAVGLVACASADAVGLHTTKPLSPADGANAYEHNASENGMYPPPIPGVDEPKPEGLPRLRVSPEPTRQALPEQLPPPTVAPPATAPPTGVGGGPAPAPSTSATPK